MGEFRVHNIRFFDFIPKAIHCLAWNEDKQKIALSRSDGSIEIWSVKDHWYQEKILPPTEGLSVEALVWCQGRLFSGGLDGEIHEHDLLTLGVKSTTSSNGGAIWCLTVNNDNTLIAAGTEEGCVVIFKISEEGIEYERALDKQEGRILSLAWHEPENVIVTGGIDNIRIWSTNSGHALQRLTLGKQELNKETIVWSIAVTNDFTIVSGDSRGKTSFWNGKQGTLIKSVQSHRADVLAVCVNDTGDVVFSSGIDPTLVQFEFIPSQPDSDWNMWVKSNTRVQHTHDVRALTMAGSYVVSGGVDCNLVFNHIQPRKGIKSWRKLPPIPQQSLVYTARKSQCVLLRYPDYLELWKLGNTSKHSDKNGDLLPLKKNPAKLLQLKSRDNEHIICAAISDNVEWLIYSDQYHLRIFQLNVEDIDSVAPKVTLSKVRYIPSCTCPSHGLVFAPDGNTLISAANNGSIQILKLDSMQPSLLATIQPKTEPAEGIHLLAVSPNGKYIATGDHSNHVHIYSLKKQKHICSLPHYHCQPTALAFHPNSTEIVVSYCDQKIFEYNLIHKEYTAWGRQLSNNFHPQWLKRHSKISQIYYNPELPHQIFVRDEQMLCIIDKTQPLPTPQDKLFVKSLWNKTDSSKDITHAFHVCSKFKYLLHLDSLQDDFLMIVERPPMAIVEKLPPTLKQKKFGT